MTLEELNALAPLRLGFCWARTMGGISVILGPELNRLGSLASGWSSATLARRLADSLGALAPAAAITSDNGRTFATDADEFDAARNRTDALKCAAETYKRMAGEALEENARLRAKLTADRDALGVDLP